MDCIFCQVISGKLPGKFAYKDEDLVVIHDISPKAPVHLLAIPTKHVESIRHIDKEDKELMGKMMLVVNKVAKEAGLHDDGYKLLINNGEKVGQVVFHLHMHIMGGWKEKNEVINA